MVRNNIYNDRGFLYNKMTSNKTFIVIAAYNEENKIILVIKEIILLIFYLWKQEDYSEAGQIKSYFASRSIISWFWRVIAIILLFFILTIIVGVISFTITGESLVESLMKVPSFSELFLITTFRSIFILLATVPIIIFWKSGKNELFLSLALITSLIYPILGDGLAYMWPVFYRLIDGTILVLHTIAMSWLYVRWLSKG